MTTWWMELLTLFNLAIVIIGLLMLMVIYRTIYHDNEIPEKGSVRFNDLSCCLEEWNGNEWEEIDLLNHVLEENKYVVIDETWEEIEYPHGYWKNPQRMNMRIYSYSGLQQYQYVDGKWIHLESKEDLS